MKYEYILKRSKRKTLSLEVSREMQIIVRAPKLCPKIVIDNFVARHESWIEKSLDKQRNRQSAKSLSPQQTADLKMQAKEQIPAKVKYYSNLMMLYPTAVKITSAEKRFGSCSGKNSLCFSYRLMQYPQDAIDYVIVHELAHIKHKNHSKNFYELIEQYMPDYKERNAILKNM
ncbi:MAG: SprT family zinc-dependent metalloprotease [Oscillospiraceae bacterium]